MVFQVIENFSQNNTLHFEKSIDVGEQDTYFLIIALHRDTSMTPEEVMSRASEVQYRVDWEIKEKNVPWGLLILAGFFLIAGVGFLIAFFISRKKYLAELESKEEANTRDKRRPIQPRSTHTLARPTRRLDGSLGLHERADHHRPRETARVALPATQPLRPRRRETS